MKADTAGLLISAIWIVFWIAKLLFGSNLNANTAQGQQILIVIYLFIIIGALILSYFFWKKIGRVAVGKAMRSNHCPQCYTKFKKGETFCKKCGEPLVKEEESKWGKSEL
ncbi:MAG: hypothetical protein M0Q19_10130 [Candidatus Cloacimonetes bacterium]|nr:hypothetical protein [Candidatus Cloacimonadota bacterium]MDD3379383.1 DUF2614 family zinc ribbon-containing protein [Candidatus Methanomethylophilaceae archaeon]